MSLARAFDGSPTLVALTRLSDDRYADVNDSFVRTLGYSREQLLDHTPVELGIWPAEERTALLEQARHFRAVATEPTRFHTHAGGEYRGLLSAEVITQDGTEFLLTFIQDIRAYEASDNARRRAEARYRSIFDHAVEAIYQSSPGGQFLDANPALAHLLGYASPQELMRNLRHIGRQLYADPALRAQLLKELEQHGHFENREVQVRKKDGSIIWVSENARAVRGDRGELLYYEGTLVDVHQRKLTESALQLSEEKYRTLVDHSQDGVFITHEGNYIYVNRAYASMLGHVPEEMINQPYMRFIAPEDRPYLENIWKQRRAGNWETNAYEIQLLKKDGVTRVLASVRSGPIMFNGKLSSTGTIRDVTEERRTQQALLVAEQKYRAIFENAVIGMYQSTQDGHFLRANQALAAIHGYDSPAQLVREVQDIRKLYHNPDERRVVNAELERHGHFANREIRMRRRDGTAIWVSLAARVVRNDDGSVAYYEGSVQDITARKQVEAALQRSEQRYRMLVDHSQVGVFINENGYYTYANHAFAAILGYTEAELTGKSYQDIFPPEEVAAADQRFAQRMRGESVPNDYESSLLHKDGKTRVAVTHSIGVIESEGRRLMIGTVRDVTAQKRSEAQLRHNATHDPITGLPNRILFGQRLAEAMARSRTPSAPGYAVLFVDLDSFKLVNDSLGHAAGDRLLVEVASRLKHCLGPWDVLARHGGDEFTILADRIAGLEDAVQLAERVLAALLPAFRLDNNEIYTNASIGIAPGKPEYATTDEVLRDADTAMYRAKETGRAGYVVFDQNMYARARARLQLETELRQALENHEFRLHYQPIMSVATRSFTGFEALLRWQHPQRGLLTPAEFLAAAEETGLILPIGAWTLQEACRQLRTWRGQLGTGRELSVAVNLSHKQFAQTELVEQIGHALREYDLTPASLHLEITETVFLETPQTAEDTLRQLKSLGVGLHLDDFGTGYSSLSYLAALPLDTMKIDRSFITDIDRNGRHAAIVRNVVRLAKDLGLQVIAEGLERAEQLEMLRKLGCDSAQGWFFAPALDEAAATRLLGVRPVPA